MTDHLPPGTPVRVVHPEFAAYFDHADLTVVECNAPAPPTSRCVSWSGDGNPARPYRFLVTDLEERRSGFDE